MKIWTVWTGDTAAAKIRHLPNGSFMVGDTLVDARGRVAARVSMGAAHPAGASGGPAWDPLTVLSAQPGSFLPPAFDPSGNAWTLLDATSLEALVSNGSSGTWQPPQTLLNVAADLTGSNFTITPAGVVYVVYSGFVGSVYTLNWLIYTPGGGWQGPTAFYRSSNPIINGLQLATDASGNLVVVFNQVSPTNESITQPWSIVYSVRAGRWDSARMISPASQNVVIPTLAQSPDGSTILLAYFVTGPAFAPSSAIYYSVYSPSSQTFSNPAAIPGTNAAGFAIAASNTVYPLIVDASGAATLVTPLYFDREKYYSIDSFVFQGGTWSAPTQLMAWTTGLQDILNFGGVAANGSGSILVVNPSDGAVGQTINAYRYAPGSGWDAEVVAQFSDTTIASARIAWFDSTEAVATYSNPQFESTVYANGSWSISPAIPPSGEDNPFHYLATAPGGEVVLLFNGPNDSTLATWLRD